jgi:hypothetical protein
MASCDVILNRWKMERLAHCQKRLLLTAIVRELRECADDIRGRPGTTEAIQKAARRI